MTRVSQHSLWQPNWISGEKKDRRLQLCRKCLGMSRSCYHRLKWLVATMNRAVRDVGWHVGLRWALRIVAFLYVNYLCCITLEACSFCIKLLFMWWLPRLSYAFFCLRISQRDMTFFKWMLLLVALFLPMSVYIVHVCAASIIHLLVRRIPSLRQTKLIVAFQYPENQFHFRRCILREHKKLYFYHRCDVFLQVFFTECLVYIYI